MEIKDIEKDIQNKKCQKCDKEIGGQAYYLVRLDCIFDGDSVSACDTVVLCSECHINLKSWLNL